MPRSRTMERVGSESGTGRRTSAWWQNEVLLAGVAVIVYLNSLSGDLVFDDLQAIKENPDVRLSTSWKSVFSHDFWGTPLSDPSSHKSYRPLTILSFRFNAAWHGLQPYGYHAVNVILHAVVSVLFQRICKLVVKGDVAFLAGFLFAVHPIHTEAVAGVVGRAELLSALFYCLSVLVFAWGHPVTSHHGSTSKSSKSSPFSLTTVTLMGLLSMLSKEQGITCLALCCTYDAVVLCRLDLTSCLQCIASSFQGRAPKWVKSLLFRCIFLVSATLLLLIGRVWLVAGGSATSFTQSDNPTLFENATLTRTLTYLYLPAFSSWLLLCPKDLCYDWSMDSIPRLTSLDDPRNLSTAALIILTVMLVAYGILHWPAIDTAVPEDASKEPSRRASSENSYKRATVIGLSMLLLPFLPASNLFFPVGFVVAERILYMPSMGFCLLVGIGFGKLTAWAQENLQSNDTRTERSTIEGEPRSGYRQRLHVLISGMCWTMMSIVLLSMTCKTLTRNSEWQSMSSLCVSGVKVNPGNAKIHFSIGNEHAQQGLRSCEYHYREAIRLRPKYTAAWVNLGLVVLNMDRAKEAEEAYKKALDINPNSGNAHTNYGHLCRLQSRWSDALHQYREAIKQQPDSPTLLHHAGVCCQKLKNFTCAAEYWRTCVKKHPSYVDSWLALGMSMSQEEITGNQQDMPWSRGKRAIKAEEALRTALKLKPSDADAWTTLTQLLLKNGNEKKAEVTVREAITILPSNSQLRYLLGLVMETRQLFPQAGKHYEAAIQLEPGHKLAAAALQRLK